VKWRENLKNLAGLVYNPTKNHLVTGWHSFLCRGLCFDLGGVLENQPAVRKVGGEARGSIASGRVSSMMLQKKAGRRFRQANKHGNMIRQSFRDLSFAPSREEPQEIHRDSFQIEVFE